MIGVRLAWGGLVDRDDIRHTRRALLAHIDTFWQLNDKSMFEPGEPVVRDRLPDLRIARMSPSGPGEPWAHVSVGAWELTAASGKGWEFMLLAPTDEPAHLETLAAVVRRHIFSPIRAGELIDLGRPWYADSPCTWMLACPPYPYNISLERLDLADLDIHIVWMMPITKEEASFARDEGVDALEQRLQDAAADFLSTRRSSVV